MLSLLLFFALSAAAIPLDDSASLEKRVSTMGISSSAAQINNIFLGFLPDFTQSSTTSLNAVIPKPAAVIGDYISVTPYDLSLGNLQWHKADIESQKVKPVYMATIMPESLYSWNSAQADAVSNAMAALNAAGVPTWVRFAYEMNGCPAWNAWGCDPAGFLQAWAIMASSLRAKAPSAKLLWAPNIDTWTGGNGGYAAYYPGDSVVDIVGLSFYSFGENQEENTTPPANYFTQTAEPFYQIFSANKGKPMVIAETSAPYHYYTGTSTPSPGGASEYNIKMEWINQLTSYATKQAFPNLIAVTWYNYEKDERDETLDFRAIFSNPSVQYSLNQLIG